MRRPLGHALVIVSLLSTVYTTAFLGTNNAGSKQRERNSLSFLGRSTSRICTGLSSNNDDDSTTNDIFMEVSDNSNGQDEMIRPLPGGPETIFEMARRMLLWDNGNSGGGDDGSSSGNNFMAPRWRPQGVYGGISDSNPDFRTKAPAMNQRGYAKSIWRNVRKRNKPALWAHALRTYERMMAVSSNSSSAVDGIMSPCNIHHEGALLACAKLGYWEKAIEIYEYVEELESQSVSVMVGRNRKQRIQVTDNMLFSVISACVRGSAPQQRHQQRDRYNNNSTTTNTTTNLTDSNNDVGLTEYRQQQEQRRKPLDTLVKVVVEPMSDKHINLPLVAEHVNPIAQAYQSIGLLEEASNLLHTHLTDRTRGPEEEDGNDQLNINDIYAKDKGSYSLLVTNSILTGNWSSAVDSLCTMTEAGLYAENRHLNRWTEVSERKSKKRATRGWKKKRDEYWLESVR